MKRSLLALAIVTPVVLAATAGSADAARSFSNCSALTIPTGPPIA